MMVQRTVVAATAPVEGKSPGDKATAVRRRRRELLLTMRAASSYRQWYDAAREVDVLEGTSAKRQQRRTGPPMTNRQRSGRWRAGKEQWKRDRTSPHYDYAMIEHQLTLLRGCSVEDDVFRSIRMLRAGLVRNLGGMGKSVLHTQCRVGTKQLIEDCARRFSVCAVAVRTC
jgi:hypothetical protein